MKREPGIDLVRCIGLLFVNGVHMFLKNGYYGEAQMGLAMWGANCFRWLFFSCNGIFLLLTGYLKSTKPFTKDYYKSLLPILVGYTLTCLITYPIRHFWMGDVRTLGEWLNNFFSFGNYAWYLEMYVGLLLFSPVINLALSQIRDDKQILGLVGMMLFLTAMPGLTELPLIPNAWTSVYPVTFYVIGAAIRRLQPRLKLWQGLSLIAVQVMGMAFASLIFTDEAFAEGFVQGNGGFWNTIVATLVFITFYRVKIPEKAAKVLAFFSPGVMEGYLLSLVLDGSLYAMLKQWHSPEQYPLLFICVTIPIFVISITAGRGVHALAARLCRGKLSVKVS